MSLSLPFHLGIIRVLEGWSCVELVFQSITMTFDKSRLILSIFFTNWPFRNSVHWRDKRYWIQPLGSISSNIVEVIFNKNKIKIY